MDIADVQEYLYRHIPLSRDIGLRVTRADEGGVTLCAPLAPNLNHEATAFGGSISALAILSGWTYLYVRLAAVTEPSRIVIQRSEVQFVRPVRGDFCARCVAPSPAEWEQFLALLDKRGKARIQLTSEVHTDTDHAAVFDGTYVAMR